MASVYYRCAKCEKLLFVTDRVIEDKAPTEYPRKAGPEEMVPPGYGYKICFPKYCPDCTDGTPEAGFP